jgi:hypothetical protein
MKKIALLCVVVLTSIALPTFATTLTFDDLPGDSTTPIPKGYNGLNWNNFFTQNGSDFPNSGYLPAVISPFNVAFNGIGTPAIISNGTFDLNSGYFTAAFNDNLQLQVVGSFMGNPLYDMLFTLSATSPTLINFNYFGVDSVEFISYGGTPHPEYIGFGFGTQFAMDNVVITGGAQVPDAASTIVLFGMALGGIGYLRRRLG